MSRIGIVGVGGIGGGVAERLLSSGPLRSLRATTKTREALEKSAFRVSQENRYLHQEDVLAMKRDEWLAKRQPEKWVNEMFRDN